MNNYILISVKFCNKILIYSSPQKIVTHPQKNCHSSTKKLSPDHLKIVTEFWKIYISILINLVLIICQYMSIIIVFSFLTKNMDKYWEQDMKSYSNWSNAGEINIDLPYLFSSKLCLSPSNDHINNLKDYREFQKRTNRMTGVIVFMMTLSLIML